MLSGLQWCALIMGAVCLVVLAMQAARVYCATCHRGFAVFFVELPNRQPSRRCFSCWRKAAR